MRLPEEAGIGATPARRASLASEEKREAPAISPRSLAALSTPQPGNSSSWGARAAPRRRSRSKLCGTPGAVANRPGELAGDADPCALGSAGKLAGDAIEPEDAVKASRRQLQLGPELVQVPAQALLIFCACLDEALAVIEQELQLQRPIIEIGGGQGPGTLSKRSAGNSKSIDRIGLAAICSPFREAPISFGGTRTTRSPEAIRKRSK